MGLFSSWLFFLLGVGLVTAFQCPAAPRYQRSRLPPLQGWFDGLLSAFENDEQYLTKTVATTIPQASSLEGMEYIFMFSLVGIPSTDPSSDLFGPKTRASDRFDTGGANIDITIELKPGNMATIGPSEFTGSTETTGKWSIDQQEKEAVLAVAFDCQGFGRKFVTKGSLQSVFGGDETTRTSSSWSIPSGPCMARAPIVLSDYGSVRLKDGTLFSPMQQGLSSSWKKAGSFKAKVTKSALDS